MPPRVNSWQVFVSSSLARRALPARKLRYDHLPLRFAIVRIPNRAEARHRGQSERIVEFAVIHRIERDAGTSI